ncbi:MAG: hypothetical protein ACTS6G_01320 [Candidatus Hodgkinia cicadicola]
MHSTVTSLRYCWLSDASKLNEPKVSSFDWNGKRGRDLSKERKS